MMTRGMKATAVALLCSMTLGLPAQAASIATVDALGTVAVTEQRAALDAFLARADVQAELERFGVEPAHAAARVAALSDAEVASLHQRVQDEVAGGSVVSALVFVFIVLLVTDILGYTKVFPFTRSAR